MTTKKRAIVLGVSIAAGLAVIGGLGAAGYYLFNQPTDYRITYELHGLSGDEKIRYQDTAFAEGFVFGTKETEETVVDARPGDMTLEAIVTEGQEAAVVIENAGAGVTCAIVQDAGDANLELLRTDEEIATAGSLACRALLD
ncbi:hypothetical protein [Microbacterium sp.]|uniref:hypothetical protein n=1 Tax=Microbacterium sp. TaxID=51671 RepID=UPI0028A1FBA6|nr:hypothetical protein [Microbacterium sp.]